MKIVSGVQATLQKSATPPLHIDSTLDSDVVYHEAMLVNRDDRIGEYSASATGGSAARYMRHTRIRTRTSPAPKYTPMVSSTARSCGGSPR